MPTPPIEIAAGEWRAAIRPQIGGSLAGLTHRGRPVLRAMPATGTSPLDAACFPLVPYANRIRDGRFSFGGHDVRLALNHPPERHSLHGIGWQRPWLLQSLVGSSVSLVLDHGGFGGWPWAWRAVQLFTLDPSGLTITLSLTNESREAMPAGLGFHPYFRRSPHTRLRFAARALLVADEEIMPTGERAGPDSLAPFGIGAPLPPALIDHCFTGWDGRAEIEDEAGRIIITADHAPHLHIYSPAAGHELCVEPVSHLPDAVNRPEWPMPALAPGETATIQMRIEES